MNLRCAEAREMLSALLDGETREQEDTLLDAHLTGCPGCARWFHRLQRLDSVLVAATERTGPELAAPVLSGWRSADLSACSNPRRKLVRILVVLAGLLQVAAGGLPAFSGQGHGTVDAGVLTAAMGIGFVIAGIQPQRLTGLFPVALAAATFGSVHMALGLVGGQVSFSQECYHLSTTIGLFTIAAIRIISARRRVSATKPDDWRLRIA